MRKVLAGLIALMLFVPIASAGPSPPSPIDIDFRKAPGKPWIEYTSQHKKVGEKTVSVFWRVTNVDTVNRGVTLKENLAGDGSNDYRIRWFSSGVNITGDVRDVQGWTWNFASGSKQKFKVTIKAKSGNPDEVCITPYFNVSEDPNGPYGYGLYVNSSNVCG